MYKYKVIFPLMMSMFMVSAAYGQEASEKHLIKSITGIVVNTDAVGNSISIRTGDQKLMAFFIPDKVIIKEGAHDIGLMDIQKADPVTIQYYVISSLKYFVISIVDNESVVNE